MPNGEDKPARGSRRCGCRCSSAQAERGRRKYPPRAAVATSVRTTEGGQNSERQLVRTCVLHRASASHERMDQCIAIFHAGCSARALRMIIQLVWEASVRGHVLLPCLQGMRPSVPVSLQHTITPPVRCAQHSVSSNASLLLTRCQAPTVDPQDRRAGRTRSTEPHALVVVVVVRQLSGM
jgi:hypothetical protein